MEMMAGAARVQTSRATGVSVILRNFSAGLSSAFCFPHFSIETASSFRVRPPHIFKETTRQQSAQISATHPCVSDLRWRGNCCIISLKFTNYERDANLYIKKFAKLQNAIDKIKGILYYSILHNHGWIS